MIKLQNIIKPNVGNYFSVERMYLSIHDGVYVDDMVILRKKLSYLSLDTYYNVFSTKIWKDECSINKISFYASGKGVVQLKIILLTLDGTHIVLSNKKISLNIEEKKILDIDLSSLTLDGLIFPKFVALEDDVEFHNAFWSTDELPKRNVKLGISITHFNRNKQVSSALKKLSENLINKKDNMGKFSLTVIDNSSNIKNEESFGQNIIPSKNLGGSGGFMRGLIHYQDDTDVTHVLFMDDDASCEIESIERTWSILSFTKKDNSAIAGSLIYENTPTILHEKGAFYDLFGNPNFCGTDLLNPINLVKIEFLPVKCNYGAWWFFAFPIDKVKYFAFPFFVRGDDIFFSLINKFNLICPLGITSYSDSFISKESPLTIYLDLRSSLLNNLIRKNNCKNLLKIYKSFFKKNLLFYRYEHIDVIRKALKNVLEGVEFWKNNIDTCDIRKEINSIAKNEKSESTDASILNEVIFENPHPYLNKLKLFLKFISLKGIFLPKKNKIVFQEKGKENHLMTYKYKKILTMDSSNNKGYITKFNLTRSIKYRILYYYDLCMIYRNFSKIKKHYHDNLDEITSKDFWKKVLELDKN